MTKVKAKVKYPMEGVYAVASKYVFPVAPNTVTHYKKPKKDWLEAHQLWICDGRVFTPTVLGNGEMFWMDAVTGSIYNVYTGRCQSGNMQIKISSICFNQKDGASILMKLGDKTASAGEE